MAEYRWIPQDQLLQTDLQQSNCCQCESSFIVAAIYTTHTIKVFAHLASMQGIRHPFLAKCLLRMRKNRKSWSDFLWQTNVSEAVWSQWGHIYFFMCINFIWGCTVWETLIWSCQTLMFKTVCTNCTERLPCKTWIPYWLDSPEQPDKTQSWFFFFFIIVTIQSESPQEVQSLALFGWD